MSKRLFPLALLCAFAAGVIAQHEAHHAKMEDGARQIHQQMLSSAKRMIESKKAMPSDTDRMFAHMMAEHHKEGILMAQLELKYGNDPKSRALAQKIINAQTKERKQLMALAMKAK